MGAIRVSIELRALERAGQGSDRRGVRLRVVGRRRLEASEEVGDELGEAFAGPLGVGFGAADQPVIESEREFGLHGHDV